MKNVRFIGITGGVGTGKSSVLEYIGAHYMCEIYLADDVANRLKEKGNSCYDSIVGILGYDVLGEDGEIDKGRMAARIFSDEALLAKVNAVLHPATIRFLMDRYEEANKRADIELFFVEAALLIETGFLDIVDEMWYVYAHDEVRRRRLAADRGYDDERINRIFAAQLSEEEFREKCDFVIDNSGDFEDTRRQIDDRLNNFAMRA